MITFTAADISSARDNDLAATQLLMEAMLPVVDNIARKLAGEVSRYGSDLDEELASEGRMELWRLISEHDGDAQHGSGWLVTSIRAAMLDSRRALLNPGASEWEVNIFLQCLKKTDYDGAAALRMATTLPAGKRLSAAAAYAAQMACTPAYSLDAQIGVGTGHRKMAEAGMNLSLGFFVCTEPYSAPEDNWNLSARIDAVHETLDRMSETQAEVVMRVHGYEQDRATIAAALDFPTSSKVSGIKTHAEKSFHAKFPWESVYPGPKPALNPNRDSRSK